MLDAPTSFQSSASGGDTPVTAMTDVDPLNLVVVDDDEAVRTALRRLLRSMGHDVQVFASAEEYEAHAGGWRTASSSISVFPD